MFWFSGNLRDKLARQSLRFRKVMPSKLEIMNLLGTVLIQAFAESAPKNFLMNSFKKFNLCLISFLTPRKDFSGNPQPIQEANPGLHLYLGPF
jgi:hypothetical protein